MNKNKMEKVRSLENARVYCTQHLADLCQEVIDRHKTNIYHDKVRLMELRSFMDFMGQHALALAEEMVSVEAMRKVISLREDATLSRLDQEDLYR